MPGRRLSTYIHQLKASISILNFARQAQELMGLVDGSVIVAVIVTWSTTRKGKRTR